MKKLICILLLMPFLSNAQVYDPQATDPPSSCRSIDDNSWHPFRPVPFEGCRVIINHDNIGDRLYIQVELSNRGYTSRISCLDSTVRVNINCVAEDWAAHAQAPVYLPTEFDLYVNIEDSDSARYQITYVNDELLIEAIETTKSIKLEPVRKTPRSSCWIQFNGNCRSLIPDILTSLGNSGQIEVLDTGYYLDFPLEVFIDKDKNSNKTRHGTIIFIAPSDQNGMNCISTILDCYRDKIIGYGHLP
nr:hypothetical protein [candidate division Zixibacteria bacterium]